MGVTAHWVSENKETGSLQDKVALIGFHRLYGSHDGVNLSNVLLEVLDRVHVAEKVRRAARSLTAR